jgi:hypothetical protein
MQEIKQKLIAAAVGIAVGIGVGGLIWGSAPEKVEIEKLVQSSITVVETRDVVIEKTVVVREIVTAERAQVIETRQPDGVVVIDSRYYGLGISRDSTAAETTTLHEASSTAAASTVTEKTTVTSKPKWLVGGGFFTDPMSPLSFDYRADWQVSVSRRVGDSPFFVTGFGGPRLIGLALSSEF